MQSFWFAALLLVFGVIAPALAAPVESKQ